MIITLLTIEIIIENVLGLIGTNDFEHYIETNPAIKLYSYTNIVTVSNVKAPPTGPKTPQKKLISPILYISFIKFQVRKISECFLRTISVVRTKH